MNVMTPPIRKTTYDRADCAIGIVHIGYGAFHRAHQAVYIDDYMQATGDLRWGIAAVNLREADAARFAESARVRDGYLLRTTSPGGNTEHRLVRSHCAYHDRSRDADAAEALLALASVHAITITVTESGYYDDGTQSLYGYLAAGLSRRRAATAAPVSILCCDNIRHNGDMLRRKFIAYLESAGHTELMEWVRGKVQFPSSMVDRITPRTTDALRAEIMAANGGEDLDPVHGESFSQWVLEDNFAAPFPALEKTGVEITADVFPYEEAKIRILNGGHTGLAYIGALAGHRTFDEAMRDPACRKHFDALEDKNILPGLTLDLPFDKVAYRDMIAERFANAAIADSLERICMDGYAKFRIFIMPTIRDCLARNIIPRHCYDAIAGWYVYARAAIAGRMAVQYIEPNMERLKPLLADGRAEDFARCNDLWGDLPAKYGAEFTGGIINAINKMEQTCQA